MLKFYEISKVGLIMFKIFCAITMKILLYKALLVCSFLVGIVGNLPLLAQKSNFTLVIDPGHGGTDPGKPRGSENRLHEKDINLLISLKIGDYIRENLPQVKVLYTRTKDEYLSLQDRAEFANRNKADFFISIHANSSPKSSIQGTETHIYHHKQAASKRLATLIEEEFRLRAARKSRGVIDAAQRGHNLYVTQYTEMPSVLVEVGYLTNPQEEAYLNSAQGQAIIASAVFRAFRTFIQQPIPAENRATYYRVQIMASMQPVDVANSPFAKLEERVYEQIFPDTEKYKYKYLIGREYDLQRARILQKKIVGMGFKDAFVARFEN